MGEHHVEEAAVAAPAGEEQQEEVLALAGGESDLALEFIACGRRNRMGHAPGEAGNPQCAGACENVSPLKTPHPILRIEMRERVIVFARAVK